MALRSKACFRDGLTVLPDEAHSRDEPRYRAIGRDGKGRAVFVVFTLRQRDDALLIRPISARYMHKKEVEHYEKSNET